MKKIISFILAACLFLFSVTPAFAEVARDETIYVHLNNNGTVNEIEAVTRLSGTPEKEDFVEYGKFERITPLVDQVTPEIKGDEIRWPGSFLKTKDIYYSGILKKDLPVDIAIRYYLNDKAVKAKDIAGKSGDFRIEIDISGGTLMTQITVPLSLEHFRNIKTKTTSTISEKTVESEGMATVVGKTMNVTFVHMAKEDSHYIIEGQATDFTLPPIQIAGSYQSVDIGTEAEDSINELSDGIRQMISSMDQLSSGSNQLYNGTLQAMGGMSQLEMGMAQASAGLDKYLAAMKPLSDGIGEFSKGVAQFQAQLAGFSGLLEGLSQMPQLIKESQKILDSMGQLKEGYAALSQGQEAFLQGLNALVESHRQILLMAQPLAQNPETAPLVQGLEQELAGLEKLAQEGAFLLSKEQEALQGLVALEEGYGKFHEGLKAMAEGAEALAQGQKDPEKQQAELKAFMEGAEELQSGLMQFQQGGVKLSAGFGELSRGMGELTGGLAKLADGQNQLTGGISAVNEQGLRPMLKGIEEATLPLTEKTVPTSFIDERNEISSISFILQTDEIKEKKPEKVPYKEEVEEKTFWERLMDLF